MGRSWAGPEGATCSVLSLVKDRDDKEAPDSDAEGYVEGLDDEEEDEDGTWDVLRGIPASKGMRGGGGRAWNSSIWEWRGGMWKEAREGTEGIAGAGMSMDKKECPGIVEILKEKGEGSWAWKTTEIRELLHEGIAWKTPRKSQLCARP